jgi:hypothetical protein
MGDKPRKRIFKQLDGFGSWALEGVSESKGGDFWDVGDEERERKHGEFWYLGDEESERKRGEFWDLEDGESERKRGEFWYVGDEESERKCGEFWDHSEDEDWHRSRKDFELMQRACRESRERRDRERRLRQELSELRERKDRRAREIDNLWRKFNEWKDEFWKEFNEKGAQSRRKHQEKDRSCSFVAHVGVTETTRDELSRVRAWDCGSTGSGSDNYPATTHTKGVVGDESGQKVGGRGQGTNYSFKEHFISDT